MKKAILITPLLIICTALTVFMLGDDDKPWPMRVLLREDGVYEIERKYFGKHWSRVGGEYGTLAEAEAGCAYWRKSDLEDVAWMKRSKQKKQVVHECK